LWCQNNISKREKTGLTTGEKIRPFDNCNVACLHYVTEDKLVFFYFVHNEITQHKPRYVYTQKIKKTKNNQGKTKTTPLPKTETANEPPHLIPNQNTPLLHRRTATQRPTTTPKHHL